MKNKIVSNIRRLQIIISSIIFVLVTIMCWNVTGFDITEIQLSVWGKDSAVGLIWNSSVVMVSLAILFNALYWIKKHNRLKYKRLFYILFSIMSLSLLLVGVFPVTYGWVHNVPAFFYFFAYPLLIFLMAFSNRRNIVFKEWIRHLTISICMIMLPLITISLFKGYAISEIIHTSVVIFWNISILENKKRPNI